MQTDILRVLLLVAWLVVAISAYRQHRVGGPQTVKMILVWIAIFLAVAAVAAFITDAGQEGALLPTPPSQPGEFT